MVLKTNRSRQSKKSLASGRLFIYAAIIFACNNTHAMLLGDSENGKVIHDSKCLGCHSAQFEDPAQIYLRSPRRVNSIEGLMKQVDFCNKQTSANLSESQINDVIKFLNETYYKFK